MSRNQIYCSVCGAPIHETGTLKGDPDEWLAHSVLLTSAYPTKNGTVLNRYRRPKERSSYSFWPDESLDQEGPNILLRLNVYSHGNERFDLLDSGEQVSALVVDPLPWRPSPEPGAPLYIPIHDLCLQLVDRFIGSIQTSVYTIQTLAAESITSEIQLWEVLYRRLRGITHSATWQLHEPHEYFGGRACRKSYWDPEDWDSDDGQDHGRMLEENPLEVPNLTSSILQNLQPLTGTGQCESSSDDARNQNWFCEALINTQIFPWLWDIDPKLVRDKQAAGSWDWRLLVRQLSQWGVQDPTESTLELPLQLRNRRRLWRILETARIGDVANVEGKVIEAWTQGEKRGYNLGKPPSTLPTST